MIRMTWHKRETLRDSEVAKSTSAAFDFIQSRVRARISAQSFPALEQRSAWHLTDHKPFLSPRLGSAHVPHRNRTGTIVIGKRIVQSFCTDVGCHILTSTKTLRVHVRPNSELIAEMDCKGAVELIDMSQCPTVESLASAIRHAMQTSGFLFIRNHGLEAQAEEMFKLSGA